MTGNSSYTGTTTIATGATLQAGNGSASGSPGPGAIIDNGILVIDHSNTISVDNDISGTGGLTLSGTGIITLIGNASYTGATTINSGGTLTLDGATSIASSSSVADSGTFNISGITGSSTSIQTLTGSGTVNLGGKLLIITASSGIFSGTTNGTGGVEISGGGPTFIGAIANDVNVDSGATLQIGNGGTSGAVAGIVSDSGTVIFNHSDSVTVPASFTGSGGLTQAGAGTLTVNSALGFSGPVNVSAGTFALSGAGSLSIGPGSGIIDNATFDISGVFGTGASIGALTGSGSVALGSKTLTLLGTGTFAGAISGTGGVVLSASGTQIFTGANSYTGTTTVALGDTLQIGNGGTSGALGSGAVVDNGDAGFQPQRHHHDGQCHFRRRRAGAVSGTAILTGANSYSDATTRAARGTLQIGSGGSLGTAIVTTMVPWSSTAATMSSSPISFPVPVD